MFDEWRFTLQTSLENNKKTKKAVKNSEKSRVVERLLAFWLKMIIPCGLIENVM